MSTPGDPGRVIALDLGARRIGVAVCDPEGRLASPYATIERSTPPQVDTAVARIVEEVGAARVIVGLPLALSGAHGEAAIAAEAEAERLRAALGVPVETVDERLTTVSASQRLKSAGVNSRKQRQGGRIDQEAAVVILESWLESRRSRRS